MADKELEELEAEALNELESAEEESAADEEVVEQTEEKTSEDIPEDEEETASEAEPSAENADDEPTEEVSEGDSPEPKEDEAKDSDNEFGIKLEKPVKIKARGMEIDINDPKELVQLAHKGFDYFKKTQELAQWRKDIEVLNKGQISTEELQLLADLKAGSKEAAAALLNQYGVDPLDLEPEQAAGYQPNQYYTDTPTEVDQVIEVIKSDPEWAAQMSEVTAHVPDDFLQTIGSDATMLSRFAEHVKTGLAQQIIPEAMKLQALRGVPFFDAYTMVGEQLIAQQNAAPQQPKSVAPQMSEKERNLRRKAATPKKKGSGKRTSFIQDAEEIWNMTEDEFLEYEAKLQNELRR